jgi:glycine/D-amino acid oxidase-like deaminating enzyme
VKRVFPQIGEVQFDYIWWGYVAATDDKMPHVYELAPGVLTWTGCNGRGVALATALGRELADIAAPVEKKLRRIAGHEFRAFGIAWTMAQNRLRDARD